MSGQGRSGSREGRGGTGVKWPAEIRGVLSGISIPGVGALVQSGTGGALVAFGLLFTGSMGVLVIS